MDGPEFSAALTIITIDRRQGDQAKAWPTSVQFLVRISL